MLILLIVKKKGMAKILFYKSDIFLRKKVFKTVKLV